MRLLLLKKQSSEVGTAPHARIGAGTVCDSKLSFTAF
jgi:hypothetical protein